jgi:hypothetical protein
MSFAAPYLQAKQYTVSKIRAVILRPSTQSSAFRMTRPGEFLCILVQLVALELPQLMAGLHAAHATYPWARNSRR